MIHSSAPRHRAVAGWTDIGLVAWQRPLAGKKTLMDLATRPATFLAAHRRYRHLVGSHASNGSGEFVAVHVLGYHVRCPPAQPTGSAAYARDSGTAGAPSHTRRSRKLACEHPRANRSTAGIATGVRPRHLRVPPLGAGRMYRLRCGRARSPRSSARPAPAIGAACWLDSRARSIRVGGPRTFDLAADRLTHARESAVLQEAFLCMAPPPKTSLALDAPARLGPGCMTAKRKSTFGCFGCRTATTTVLGAQHSGLFRARATAATIARTIGDTPVLILDEATVYRPGIRATLLQQALNRLTRDRTVLVIAHRLHTITGPTRSSCSRHGRIVSAAPSCLPRAGRHCRLWTPARAAGWRSPPSRDGDDPHLDSPLVERPARQANWLCAARVCSVVARQWAPWLVR